VDYISECDTATPLGSGVLGCQLTFITLTGIKYGLTTGNAVIARVTASNLLGSVVSGNSAGNVLLP
jgi:hypothetical protein